MQRKLMALLIVMTSSAFAQTSAPLAEDDPTVWSARAARAASLKEEATHMRNAANAQRAHDDIACRKKIFENACKNSAREAWIEQINKVRAMEIEAVGLERNQRAHEVAVREKGRASNPPRPPLILPADAATPHATPPAAADKRLPGKPKTPAKPTGARKRDDHESQARQEQSAQQAALRAAQAKKDAARYAARASEHAQKEADRKAGKSSSAAARSAPAVSAP
jgi:hypothetical protein